MYYQLNDYGLCFKPVKIFYDNSSVICLSKNPVHHSRSKHIDVNHHFIRDHISKRDIELSFARTDFQLDGIFTKPQLEERFFSLEKSLGIIVKTFWAKDTSSSFPVGSYLVFQLVFCVLPFFHFNWCQRGRNGVLNITMKEIVYFIQACKKSHSSGESLI